MNKTTVFTIMAGALLLASCQSSKNAVTAPAVGGEWTVTEVQGTPVTAQSRPYIGFSPADSLVYGYAGCNRISGSFTLDGNKIVLGPVASTMMACPDMTLEQSVLQALNSVETVEAPDSDHLTLSGKDKTPVMRLEKRYRAVPLSEIGGEWQIVDVFGEPLPAMDETPTVNFDLSEKRIAAYAGCNRLGASFTAGDRPGEMTVSNVLATRMACPDMSVEENVISALQQVRTYGVTLGGKLLLLSADGNAVMTLMR